MRRFGLIGKTLTHSFSQKYFQEKFETENIADCSYENLEFPSEHGLHQFLSQSDFSGLNVTIPYKEAVLKSCCALSKDVQKVGAANVLKMTEHGWEAHNSDVYGFRALLRPHLRGHHQRALILGSGGAAKAVGHVLRELGLPFIYVSRTPEEGQANYDQLNSNAVRDFNLIVNTTPLGTYPVMDECPDIPYHDLSESNLLIDLVYNPAETLFMRKGKKQGAMVANGLEMLKAQAEKSWEIWHLDSAR